MDMDMDMDERETAPGVDDAAPAIIGDAITALASGARERDVANQGILALQTLTAIRAAQEVATASHERLGRALVRLQTLTPPEDLADLHEPALDLAGIVYGTWTLENDLLELMAQGRMDEAAAIGREVGEAEIRTDFLGRLLSRRLHQLSGRDHKRFAALRLSRPVLVGFGFPDPQPPQVFDTAAWLNELVVPLQECDRTERAIALRAEAERWQLAHVDLLRQRDDLPPGMSPMDWFAALQETGGKVNAIRALLTGDEGWESLAAVPARLDGQGQQFTLAVDGSGDFATLEEAVMAVPPGSRLLIRPGRYLAGALIGKTLEIVGDGPRGSVVFEGEFHSVIPVMALGGVMRNVTIRNVGGPDRYGLWITNGEMSFEDCVVSSTGHAAVFVSSASAAPRFRSCEFSGPASHGLLVREATANLAECRVAGAADAGISLDGGSTLDLEGCAVERNGGSGIDISGPAFAQMRDCRIEENGGDGVRVAPGGTAWLWNCELGGNLLSPVQSEVNATVQVNGTRIP